jgi:hypothetical protein
MAGFEREPRCRVTDLAIRALGGPRGPRVEPGRARIPALRAQGCWFPRWRGAKCRHESSGGSGLPASCAPAGASARRRRSGRDPGCVGKVSGARIRQTHRLGLGGDELGGSLDRLGDDSATDGDLAGGLTGAADGLRVADGRHGEGSGHGGHVHEEAFSGAGVNTERSASTRRASQRVRAGSSSNLTFSISEIKEDLNLPKNKLGSDWSRRPPGADGRKNADGHTVANDVDRSSRVLANAKSPSCSDPFGTHAVSYRHHGDLRCPRYDRGASRIRQTRPPHRCVDQPGSRALPPASNHTPPPHAAAAVKHDRHFFNLNPRSGSSFERRDARIAERPGPALEPSTREMRLGRTAADRIADRISHLPNRQARSTSLAMCASVPSPSPPTAPSPARSSPSPTRPA